MTNTRKVQSLVKVLDERVRAAEDLRDRLSGDLKRAQFNYEALSDAQQVVTDILTALNEPEEPPF